MSKSISLEYAIEIVLDLATESVLQEKDCDDEQMGENRKLQLAAIEKVFSFFKNNLE